MSVVRIPTMYHIAKHPVYLQDISSSIRIAREEGEWADTCH